MSQLKLAVNKCMKKVAELRQRTGDQRELSTQAIQIDLSIVAHNQSVLPYGRMPLLLLLVVLRARMM